MKQSASKTPAEEVAGSYLTMREAARVLGVSMDTLRRWDAKGTIKVVRDKANRRMIPESEVQRLAPMRTATAKPRQGSARNQMLSTVTDVQIEGLLARVEMETTQPARLVAIITREAAEDLNLKKGDQVDAIVKATSMMVARSSEPK